MFQEKLFIIFYSSEKWDNFMMALKDKVKNGLMNYEVVEND